MNLKQRATRRSIFGKGMAAALALGGLALPAATLARSERDLDNEYYMRVFYDRNGKATKVCYYDRYGKLMYCDPA